jgi:hypothetical protein
MINILRIFYKAYYKTRNRREHTISGFSGLFSIILTTWSGALIFKIVNRFFYDLGWHFFIIVSVVLIIAVWRYFITTFKKYVEAQFRKDEIFIEIPQSVMFCRLIIFILGIFGVVNTLLTIKLLFYFK